MCVTTIRGGHDSCLTYHLETGNPAHIPWNPQLLRPMASFLRKAPSLSSHSILLTFSTVSTLDRLLQSSMPNE